jgi:hypothetical protein
LKIWEEWLRTPLSHFLALNRYVLDFLIPLALNSREPLERIPFCLPEHLFSTSLNY